MSSYNIKKKHNYFRRLGKDIRHNFGLYFMSLPAFIFIIIFAYVPMLWLLMAFQDYTFVGGLFGSEWIGFEHFLTFFNSFFFWDIIWNTLSISLYALIVGFTLPIAFALILNSIGFRSLKKSVQMLSYAPYFISVVVLVSMINLFFDAESGIFNVIMSNVFGIGRYDFISSTTWFRSMYVWSGMWQSVGWASIIYISILSGVSPELYDAAKIDGASKFQILRKIEFPALSSIIIIQLILAMGSILNVGFEKIYLMQNSLNLPVSDVISTYVYRLGILGHDYGFGAAVGLFNAVIAFILVFGANLIARRTSDYSLW